jgi:hypothetical protein
VYKYNFVDGPTQVERLDRGDLASGDVETSTALEGVCRNEAGEALNFERTASVVGPSVKEGSDARFKCTVCGFECTHRDEDKIIVRDREGLNMGSDPSLSSRNEAKECFRQDSLSYEGREIYCNLVEGAYFAPRRAHIPTGDVTGGVEPEPTELLRAKLEGTTNLSETEGGAM